MTPEQWDSMEIFLLYADVWLDKDLHDELTEMTVDEVLNNEKKFLKNIRKNITEYQQNSA